MDEVLHNHIQKFGDESIHLLESVFTLVPSLFRLYNPHYKSLLFIDLLGRDNRSSKILNIQREEVLLSTFV